MASAFSGPAAVVLLLIAPPAILAPLAVVLTRSARVRIALLAVVAAVTLAWVYAFATLFLFDRH